MDFEIMAQIATAPLTLAVPVGSPFKTLSDLVNEAKKNPGTVSCGNAGTYGGIHLPMIRFEKIAGIKLNHVPFKGSSPAMTALAGGHVMSAARFPAEGEPLVEAGKVRILTIFDSKRCKFYPNVPTSKEEGFPMEAMAWRTIFAPKGTPKAVLTYWNNIIKKVTEDRSFIEKAEKLKMNIEFKSAEDLKRDIQKEIQNFSELAKELGLKPM
jgi:tripartite-type tricarboxylate transporter receptor subunit TctC